MERYHLGYPGLDGRIILRCSLRKWYVGYGVDISQDSDRWRTLVNAVMNIPFL